jgi:hypothetical protein
LLCLHPSGNFAIHPDFTGNTHNFNSRIAIAYSKRLSEKLYSGLQIDLLTSRFSEDNNAYQCEAGFEFGIIYRFTEITSAGIHIANPYNLRLSKNNQNPLDNICIRGGIHTKYNQYFIVALEAEYRNNSKLNLKAGVESEAWKNITLRGGVNSYPFSTYGGIGIKRAVYKLDFSLAYYPTPGLCPSVTLTFGK